MPSRKLLACFAIVSLYGCAPKADDSAKRLSDTELLSVNLKCREAADRHVKENTQRVGAYSADVYIWKVKYSQTHRRCVAYIGATERTHGKIVALTEELLDPVANSFFAIKIKNPIVDGYTFSVDRSMKGGGGPNNPTVTVDEDEFRQFIDSAISAP
jgi:hypothetical protein